ncbi:hypothetical protein [Nitrospira sp. Nam80]
MVVFINYRGKRTKKCFGEGKQGKNAANLFAEKLSARLKWAETGGEPIVLSEPDNKMPTAGAYLSDWLQVYAQPHRIVKRPRSGVTSGQ